MTKNQLLTPLLIVVGSLTLTPSHDPAGPPAQTSLATGPQADVALQQAPAVAPSPSLTADQRELVEWARGRFETAGLELPPVTVRFDPTRELCHRHLGLYEQDESGHRITICTFDGDTFGARLAHRRTLLHEFAHVWGAANLDDDDRIRLVEQFGLDAWIDGADEWHERGIEHFAEVFVFGLLDQPRRSLEIDVDCPEAAATFEAITGVAPLGPGLPWCVESA